MLEMKSEVIIISSLKTSVKYGDSEHTFNELTLTAKGFSFPVILFHVVNKTDIANYAYNEAKLPFRGTSLQTCFTVQINYIWNRFSTVMLNFFRECRSYISVSVHRLQLRIR